MNIFVTGGTGLIGKMLVKNLINRGNQVTILSRSSSKIEKIFGNSVVICNSLDNLSSLDGYDVVFNLAGEPIIGKRWSKKQKEILCHSRWDITEKLSKLIKSGINPPKVFISGSAVGYYGVQRDNILTEVSNPTNDFLHQLCSKWEELALSAQSDHTRVCISRTGIVLSKYGGMLSMLILPFRFGLGASIGKGSQYISWIHIQDMVNALIFLMETPEISGVFNLTAPNPVTNKRFSNILSATLYRPRLFKIPGFIVKLFLGEASTMILDGQRVIPQKLSDFHFRFMFEHLDEALRNILKGRN